MQFTPEYKFLFNITIIVMLYGKVINSRHLTLLILHSSLFIYQGQHPYKNTGYFC
jgi:hypothetical protein